MAEKSFTISFTSDIHGYLTDSDYSSGKHRRGGLSRLAPSFKHGKNCLIIDGGDTIQGSPLTYSMLACKNGNAEAIARCMNCCGYDYVTVGNHDFSYGRDSLESYLKTLNGECLCANITGTDYIKKTAVITLENGLKVGLTGVTSHFVTRWEPPENYEGLCINDAFASARDACSELRNAGADVLICIYHGGFENDVETGKQLSSTGENQGWRICSELDFDILLTAHQHNSIPCGCKNGTYFCQCPDKGSSYAEIIVSIGDNGNVSVTSELKQPGEENLDEVLKELASDESLAQKMLDKQAGTLDIPLVPQAPLYRALNGSYLANFFNQVQLWATDADISAASIANEVKGFEECVTFRDIASNYPFPNTLKVLLVNRSILKAALERCAAYFDVTEDSRIKVSDLFLKPVVQHFNYDFYSGIDYVFNLSQPIGERVVSIKFHGCELSDDEYLKLCLNNYRASGAGGYPFFAECEVVQENLTDMSELIMSYLKTLSNTEVDKTRWLTLIDK